MSDNALCLTETEDASGIPISCERSTVSNALDDKTIPTPLDEAGVQGSRHTAFSQSETWSCFLMLYAPEKSRSFNRL